MSVWQEGAILAKEMRAIFSRCFKSYKESIVLISFYIWFLNTISRVGILFKTIPSKRAKGSPLLDGRRITQRTVSPRVAPLSPLPPASGICNLATNFGYAAWTGNTHKVTTLRATPSTLYKLCTNTFYGSSSATYWPFWYTTLERSEERGVLEGGSWLDVA